MALNTTLNGAMVQVINSVDSTYRVNLSCGNPLLAATDATTLLGFPVATGPGTVLSLPAATIWFLYVKCNGVGNITVQKQVTGGALVTAINSEVLLPSGLYIYAQPAETSGGIIAVTLVASAGSTTADIVMAS